jgi:hypothetical protein
MAEQQVVPLNWAQFEQEIEKRAGIEIKTLPRKAAYLWVPKRNAIEVQLMIQLLTTAKKNVPAEELMNEMTPMFIRRLGVWPMNHDYVVAEMFDDEAELRVYAVAAKNSVMQCVRYKIVKACPVPTFGYDEMLFETWTDAIVEEWQVIDSDVNAAEVEREAVVEYLKAMPDDYRVKDAAEDVEEGLHLVDTDDEEEGTAEDGEEGGDDSDGQEANEGVESAAAVPSNAAAETTAEAAAT